MVLLLALILAAGPGEPAAASKKKPSKSAPAKSTPPPPIVEVKPVSDAPLVAPPPPPPPVVKAREPVKIGANEWCKSGLDKTVVETIEARFYDLLENAGLSVVAPKDVAAVLGLERQKMLIGCTEEASCLAEIAGALGVDAILYGCVVKAGSGFTVTLRAVGAATAKPVASYSERVASEDKLQDWLDSSAKLMSLQLRQELGGEVLTKEITTATAAVAQVKANASPAEHKLRSAAWVPLAVGAVGGAAAVVGLLQARAANTELTQRLAADRAVTPEAERIAARGNAMQIMGWAGVGVAAAGVVTAAVFFFLPSGKGPTPVALIGPSGALVGVAGTLP